MVHRSSRLGVTALKDKLVTWNADKHKDQQTVPADIDVLLDDGEKDYDGVNGQLRRCMIS